MRCDAADICREWEAMLAELGEGTALNRDHLVRFVSQHFAPPGSDSVSSPLPSLFLPSSFVSISVPLLSDSLLISSGLALIRQ